MCAVTDLNFGSYYWFEVSPPEGHELPADRTSPLVTINASNAGTAQSYTFTNTRLPGALQVQKLDAADEVPLAGAAFDLVLDDGDGTYEAGVDDVDHLHRHGAPPRRPADRRVWSDERPGAYRGAAPRAAADERWMWQAE